jgi:DNA (cytosine-5)-methyltransferase 1
LKSKLTVVDLFCGCGGASIGIKMAGHDVVAAVDVDQNACNTYARNIGLTPICGDLNEITGKKIRKHYGIRKNDVDVVIGCPPCQGFSSLRATTGKDVDNKRNRLINVFLKRISEIDPRIVIFENVVGIMRGEGKEYLDRFLRKISKQGYRTNTDILIDVADYGVPQHRKRVVVTGIKDFDFVPSLPQQQYYEPTKIEAFQKPWRTVRDAIGDLPSIKAGESCPDVPNHNARTHSKETLKIIKALPKNGGSRRDLPVSLWLPCHKRLNKGAESVYGRMRWDQPGPTITCRCTTASSGRFIHPEQDRAITIREAARLQTFPDDFIFPSVSRYSENQIGNAVPPQLIKTIFHNLAEVS